MLFPLWDSPARVNSRGFNQHDAQTTVQALRQKRDTPNLSADERDHLDWLQLPSEKAEAEKLVAHLFAKCLPDGEKAVVGTLGLQPETIVKPLPESDHDFVILGTQTMGGAANGTCPG